MIVPHLPLMLEFTAETIHLAKSGLDVLFDSRRKLLAGKRIGLLANPSAIDSSYRFILDLFLGEPSWKIGALFGPEHGLRSEMQDQEWCDGFKDPQTGLPVYSLYGERLKPEPQMLQGLDAVVYDIQDVGSRYYTFIYTLAYMMEACGQAGIEVVVLDRPNPINGVDTEGPMLEPGYESFVGRYPLPTRHAMTTGELALYFREECGIRCRLEVVGIEGWDRNRFYEDTGLPWVLPSPNMPIVDTAMVYPGQCLLEGTNVSEGRGTTRPFEIFGAPWIQPDTLCRQLASYRLPGVVFRPLFFRPTFNKFARELCGGAQIHVLNRRDFRPVKTTLCILHAFLSLHPQHFRWKQPPYEYVTDRLPIDILFGNSWIREALERGDAPDAIEARWLGALQAFGARRSKYLLY